MSNAVLNIRHKLYDYIRMADDKKLQAIYILLENKIQYTRKWWKDQTIIAEFDQRYQAFETGTDKGISLDELATGMKKRRKKRYG